MIYSMTGFGRDIVHMNNTIITVEIRSVNHRYLDISLNLPRPFMIYEDKIKKTIRNYFKRGRIEVFIHVKGNQLVKRSLEIDWDLLEQYVETLEQIKQKYKILKDIPMTMIQTIPEVITVQEKEEGSDEMVEPIINSIQRASNEVLEKRKQEADGLIKDINKRINNVENTVKLIGNLKDTLAQKYHQRIIDRMNEYINGEVFDEQRLHQEIALLIEKGDITEEITRLGSHIEQFKKHLKVGGSVGRILDFILQEMNREINTIGSKALDAKMSEKVVYLKSEIEKIREQIQNIE